MPQIKSRVSNATPVAILLFELQFGIARNQYEKGSARNNFKKNVFTDLKKARLKVLMLVCSCLGEMLVSGKGGDEIWITRHPRPFRISKCSAVAQNLQSWSVGA